MRTLTEIFAPGAPLLPEGLRTLRVSPQRFVQPGETVHAQFLFRNLGGGVARGFRVRFRLPEGLTYLVGTAKIDDTALDEQGGLTTLLQGAGADIGEVPAGGERRISLDYTVASAIENGTQLTIQAAVGSFEVPVIGSNVVRLLVRSKPLLKNPKTRLYMTAISEAKPGEELQVRALVHNSGESSAHDLMVFLPVPTHTSFVENSARVNGRSVTDLFDTEPFGLSRPRVVAPVLAPGGMLEVAYRARIDAVLDEETPIGARAAVCSQELAEFELEPITLKVPSAASFQSDETSFTVDCADDVRSGERIRAVARVRNAGTATASNVRVKIGLPDGIAFCPGSRTIDGAAAPDGKERGLFVLGDVEPQRTIEVAVCGTVKSPLSNATELPLTARIEWAKGARTLTRTLTARSLPAFPSAFNLIRRNGPRRAEPGDAVSFSVVLLNLGTDMANDARVQLEADLGLQNLRVLEGAQEIALDDNGMAHLDVLTPGAGRTLQIEARLADVLDDEAQLRLRATLRAAQLEPIDLGTAVHVVSSRPRFSIASSHFTLDGTDAVRLNRVTVCRLALVNEGTDRARDVRVHLQRPDEITIDRVEGAGRDGDVIVFGDLAAGQSREAKVYVRVTVSVADGEALEMGARLFGHNVVPLSLEPLTIATQAEASFVEGAALTAAPPDIVDAGFPLGFTLWLRNSGDGPAKRLSVRFDMPTNTTYAPGSTSVNDVALLDFAGASALFSPTGLTLADVAVGADVIVRLRTIVNSPLVDGSMVEARAFVACDEQPEMTVRCQPVRVRSIAALPVVDPVLPFTVVDAAPAPVEMLPSGNGHSTHALPHVEQAQLPPPEVQVYEEPTFVSLSLGDERLAWTIRYLEEGGTTGLVPHLMVLRAFFPDDASGADTATRDRVRAYRERLSESVDRLFVRLRLPDVSVTSGDLETQALRDSLSEVVTMLGALPRPAPYEKDGLRLIGAIQSEELAAAAAALRTAAVETAAPWLAMTLLLGSSLERDGKVVADLRAYRTALRDELAPLQALSADEFIYAVQHAPVKDRLVSAREELLRALSSQARALR